jgi:hypothetical protein
VTREDVNNSNNNNLRGSGFGLGRKVVGSTPDLDIGIFHKFNPSGRLMALTFLTEMYSSVIS